MNVREAGAYGRRLLADGGLPDARLESAILLGHVLHLDFAGLLIHADTVPSGFEIAEFRALLVRRVRREPSAYLTGVKSWLDMAISVNRNVLIPRPETEILAGLAIAEASNLRALLGRPPTMIDVGTGSGALACALARAFPMVHIMATDTEAGALRTARGNGERLAGGRIDLLHCDLLPLGSRTELVVANLPYIPTAELANLEPELAYEPGSALDGGDDGLAAIRALLKRLSESLSPGGIAWLECHYDQATRISRSAQELMPGCRTAIHTDLAGIYRFVRIEAK